MSEEGWEMKHSPYTPEGSVESARKFGRVAAAKPRRPEVRRLAVLIVVALVSLSVLTIVGALLTR